MLVWIHEMMFNYVLLGEIQEACRFAKMIAILRYASKSYMNWSL